MSAQNTRKHAHKRSSSLIKEDENSRQEDKIAFTCQIGSEETMKLLLESESKNQFQIIVQSLQQKESSRLTDSLELSKIDTQHPFSGIFSEYFQIQSVHFLKRSNIDRQKTVSNDMDLQKLGTQPKAKSRLRYHQNIKQKAFNAANLNLSFSGSGPGTNLDELYCGLRGCVQA